VARTRAHNKKEEIRRGLEKTRTKLFEAIGGLTEEQMRRRPGPSRWSVAEIMAHLPVWERQVLRQAESTPQTGGGTVVLPSRSEREEAAARGRRLPPPGIVHDLVAARWETLTLLERLTARDLAGGGGRQEQDGPRVARILTTIVEYEEEQAGRIQRLRDELGLPHRQPGPRV
jgi:hypothetical protein